MDVLNIAAGQRPTLRGGAARS